MNERKKGKPLGLYTFINLLLTPWGASLVVHMLDCPGRGQQNFGLSFLLHLRP